MNGEEKVVNVAKEEVGYLEKRSNKDLDSKTANVGNNNYTKYARDLFPTLQGQPWCDMFVDWCFVQAFGQVQARQLIGGNFNAYTPTSAKYYKNLTILKNLFTTGVRIWYNILSGCMFPYLQLWITTPL